MRANKETYEEVAEHCSSFSPVSCSHCAGTFSNSYDEEEVSCTKCKHFDEEKYCKLDLFDQIVKNRDISLH